MSRARACLDFVRRRLHDCWHPPERRPWTVSAVVGGLWLLAWFDASAWWLFGRGFQGVGFTAGAAVAGWWVWRQRRDPQIRRRLVQTLALPFLLQWLWFVVHAAGWPALARAMAQLSIAILFLTGLAWLVWWLERWARRAPPSGHRRSWDPRRLDARYYRRRYRRLDQSVLAFASYSLVFLLVGLMLTRLSGCREIYEMPAGGGEVQLQQTVQVERVIRQKFVINPLSAVLFNPPPIEDIPLQLQEITEHRYQLGQGAGTAAGFATGTERGRVRFIRLQYDGGDWDLDAGGGSDVNMLMEYGIRTGHRVHDQGESRPIARLANFPPRQSPPFVFMTGQRNIIVSDREVEILRDYLLENRGLLFASNGGSQGWHGQFFSLMNRVLPNVRPVTVPLDHPIHRFPYQLPFLPYVAPHGGRDAWGWVVDGRLVVYYHPGDIGDAWSDGHAGVPRHIWEYCYQLGTNVILYAHAQYHRWLESAPER